MPEERPTQTPIPTIAPETDPGRERRTDPSKLCPDQKLTITRTISPSLPD